MVLKFTTSPRIFLSSRDKLQTVTFLLLVLVCTSPRGVLEGGQGHVIGISNKIDWWGSLLPIITTSDSASNYFVLSVFSLTLFWLGLRLAFSSINMNKYQFVLFMILFITGGCFVIQNVRDAFLLSFAMLSFGLFEKFGNKVEIARGFLFLLPLVIGVTFKYPTAFAITSLLIYRQYTRGNAITTSGILKAVSLTVVIMVAGISFDKFISNAVNIKKSNVEQSVLFHDLASIYCWSDNLRARELALEALSPALLALNPNNICAVHRPNAWIYLVSKKQSSSYPIDPPLRVLTYLERDEFYSVFQGWVRTIIHDPVSFIQVKAIFATQILLVGNPFKFARNDLDFTDLKPQQVPIELIWKAFSLLLILVGTTYIFSIFALITLLVVALIRNKFTALSRETILSLFFIQSLNVIVLSLTYVSDEARYIFPSVFISYVLLTLNFRIRNQTESKELVS